MKQALILQLQETSRKIALFEGKYNKEFQEFRRIRAKSPKKRSYELESDYLDWEALEDYKQELMRTIHSL
jgi:menaquinone-dependent protoporphyrinogen IX oxidase